MKAELEESEWQEIERRYWLGRLLGLLERRAVVLAFRQMTAHVPPAAFEFDGRTRCMRRAG